MAISVQQYQSGRFGIVAFLTKTIFDKYDTPLGLQRGYNPLPESDVSTRHERHELGSLVIATCAPLRLDMCSTAG
jgi:hypothetical protein